MLVLLLLLRLLQRRLKPLDGPAVVVDVVDCLMNAGMVNMSVCVLLGGEGKQRSVCVTPVKDNGGVRWVNVVVVVVVAVSFCCGCGNGRSVGVAMCINATQQAKMHVCH